MITIIKKIILIFLLITSINCNRDTALHDCYPQFLQIIDTIKDINNSIQSIKYYQHIICINNDIVDTIKYDFNDTTYKKTINYYDFSKGYSFSYNYLRLELHIDSTINYINHIKNGLSIHYSGTIDSILCYENGMRTSSIYDCLPRYNGTGSDTIKHAHNKIYMTYNYKNNSLHGLLTYYNSIQYIDSLICYQNGIRTSSIYDCLPRYNGTGSDTIRHIINNRIYIIYNYKNDSLHGILSYHYNEYHDSLICYQNGIRVEPSNTDSFTCP